MADEKKTPAAPVADEEDPLEARVRELEVALAASRAAVGGQPIPTHGAGKGDKTHETWSKAEQEAAHRG